MKVIATSDLHIGGTSHYDAYNCLLDIVKREKPDLFIKVGDNYELIWNTWEKLMSWQPSLNIIDHEKEIARTICPVIVIPGNHDKDLPEYKKQLYPIKVGNPVELVDGVIYTHGHQFDPSIKYWWEPLERLFKKLVPSIGLWLFGSPLELKKAGKDVSYSRQCGLVESNFTLWLKGRSGIFGHTHSEFVKFRHNQIIANAGDFYDSCSFLRVINGKPILDWI